jgi:ribonuclease E
MLQNENPEESRPETTAAAETAPDAAPAKKAPAKKAAAKKTAAKKATAKKATAKKAAEPAPTEAPEPETAAPTTKKSATKKTAAKKTAAKKSTTKKTAAKKAAATPPVEQPGDEQPGAPAAPLFQPPQPAKTAKTAKTRPARTAAPKRAADEEAPAEEPAPSVEAADQDDRDDEQGTARRRRRRGGRRRRKGNGEQQDEGQTEQAKDGDQAGDSASAEGERQQDTDEQGGSSSRRRRRRRRPGDDTDGGADDPEKTVTRVRKPRKAEDEITSLSGSTRLEAKKQRRREGREAGRRRAPIVSEAEFLARREAVDRVMVIRQRNDLTQIAVLEDKVLVEHYVARESQTSLIGNVYLGRVQNVLPSMEAAFIDIGKGRNAVLYAGEVNWDALGAKDGPRKIEHVLKSGQSVLVQITKDPIGHKGARLTSQISLPGRFLVYVPDGTTSGISRKLPDTERNRLKTLLKEIVPDTAGVIVRTAAEGASEDELTRDVERLTARWEDISAKVAKGNAPQLLYGEPDLTLKVVRDLFTEDFRTLVVAGDDAWDTVEQYVGHVAPDLADRLQRYDGDRDVFAEYRIDEQIAKGLDRKVWLPSGGSLIIDRTEAMTVVDVNTGKFTGSGGNLEETVTKNNLEAADEIVRQLRLRDIGGIIVVDFIDMVLESNRDLVLRRLVECLGRDRTRHQVAEVTSLGLVQMTRKRIGTGLLEAFSETCEHCQGRGVLVQHDPVEPRQKSDDEPRRGRRSRGRGKAEDTGNGATPQPPTPNDIAAMARPEPRDLAEPLEETEVTDVAAGEPVVADEPIADESAAEAPTSLEPEREQPAEPAATRIVTYVCRSGARRPAGPPGGVAANGAPSDVPEPASAGDGTGPTEPADDEPAPEPAAVHVPVKKKGSRKR